MAIAKVGTEIYNLLRLGFLKAESAGSDRAIKAATTKYNKALSTNPEFARVESIRLNGDTQRNVQDLGERTIITPDSLLGNVLVPVAGDRTLTGNTLTKSQGFGLLDNVDINGGPKFMMEHQDKGLGWASMQGAAKQKQKNFDLAARETDNPNVVGVYNAMGDEANNFATPIADVIINQLSGNKIPKEVISEFDDTIRKANPNWVGINHPEARSQLMGLDGYPKKGSGALRSRFTKLASMAKYRDKGFPSRDRIRDDVVEPELLGARRGDSGFTMFDAVPNGETIPFTENPSYDTGILGQFRGGLTESVPAEIMFPDVFNELSKKVNKAGNTLSRGEILGSLVMDPKLYQKADQKWLDNIAGYLEKNQGKLGASLPAVAVSMLGAGASDDADAGVLGKAKGLLMDAPSRMARAKEQGFNKDSFHYSRNGEDIKEIREGNLNLSLFDSLGIHTGSKDAAAKRAASTRSLDPNTGRRIEPSGPTYPFKIKHQKPLLNKDGNPYSESELHSVFSKMAKDKNYGDVWDIGVKEKLRSDLWDDYDVIPYINEVEDAGNVSYISPPSAVRSKYAAFDPAKTGSSNLLASNPVATTGAGLLGLGAAAQSNDTYADYSPSNLARLRSDDVGSIEAPQSMAAANIAGLMGSINKVGYDDPLLGMVASQLPSELMNKIAYNDKRGLLDYAKAYAGLLGF